MAASPPRVFLSYARKDAEVFATALRCRLGAQGPELSLCAHSTCAVTIAVWSAAIRVFPFSSTICSPAVAITIALACAAFYPTTRPTTTMVFAFMMWAASAATHSSVAC